MDNVTATAKYYYCYYYYSTFLSTYQTRQGIASCYITATGLTLLCYVMSVVLESM